MVKYIEDVDYQFVEVNGDYGVKILSEDYLGVIYTYSDVTMTEASEDADPNETPAVLSFYFNVVNGENYTPEEFETIEFRDKIGNILLSIFKGSIDESE